MSSRIEKIQTLVELSEAEESKALETFSTVQSQFHEHLDQLDALRSYVDDYAHQNLDKTLSSIQMLSTQAFVGKLHHAIENESSKTERFKEVVEKAREAWIEKRSRVKALQNLLLKLKQNRQASLDKQEQNFLDDLSSQAFSRKIQKK
ncbi:MAG: flagellar export protein FliJ [Thiotrichales bacterium]|nr:flagellar export protein FliJ [Thiotrichales bacterium]